MSTVDEQTIELTIEQVEQTITQIEHASNKQTNQQRLQHIYGRKSNKHRFVVLMRPQLLHGRTIEQTCPTKTVFK